MVPAGTRCSPGGAVIVVADVSEHSQVVLCGPWHLEWHQDVLECPKVVQSVVLGGLEQLQVCPDDPRWHQVVLGNTRQSKGGAAKVV